MEGFDHPACVCCGEEGCEMDEDGACEDCAMQRQHFYAVKHFLAVASNEFRENLRIWQKVGSYVRNMIPESEIIKLEAPNGRVYPIKAKGELGDIVLRSGWNVFASANDIEEDCSILFVSTGNSIFKVHIFDSSGHEKFSCSQPPSGVSGAVPSCDDHLLNEQVVLNHGHVTSTDFDYTMLPGCRLTEEQYEKVQEKSHTMRSEIPRYLAAMSKSNVSHKNCYVYIPLRLVDHFKDSVQLEGPQKTVCVGASKHSNDKIVLESGWHTFVASHRIQENDLLIFKIKENTRLEVLILDPIGLEKTSKCFEKINPFSAQETCDNSAEIADPPPPLIIDLTSSVDDNIVIQGTRESSRCAKAQKLFSTSSPCTKSGHKSHKSHDCVSVKLGVGSEPLSKHVAGVSQRPYMLTKGTDFPLQVEKKVEALVQKLQSKHPIFVRVMTINTVDRIGVRKCQMVFCMEYASACLPNSRQTLLLQLEDKKKQWKTTLDVVRNRYTLMRRISSGWKEIGLKAGDICLFEPASSNAGSLTPTMTVHLIRKSEAQM